MFCSSYRHVFILYSLLLSSYFPLLLYVYYSSPTSSLHNNLLYNVTIGGCTVTGDSVSDTPAERQPYYGCNLNNIPDTCTGGSFPGRDPIRNYMDYSDDVCMTGRWCVMYTCIYNDH